MSLFNNEKKPCPICSNPTPKIFPTNIGNQPICRECDKQISMEYPMKQVLTLEKLREHLAYREKNAMMHEIFTETRKVGNGVSDCTIFIDDKRHLWYVKSRGNEPIFRFDEMVAFSLLEDKHIIERGRVNGKDTFPSFISDGKTSNNNLPEKKVEAPVHTICLEIEVDNIYWQKLKLSFSPPAVVDNDINRFRIDYSNKLTEIKEYSKALMSFFPVLSINEISSADELIKFKQLMVVGAITLEEYNQMKKELVNF